MSPLIPKHRVWPAIIVAVLVIDVLVGLVLIRVANSDPHAAIEANYDFIQSLVHPTIAWSILKQYYVGVDLSGYSLDDKAPPLETKQSPA